MTCNLIFSSVIYWYVNTNILNHCVNGQFCLCKCCMIIFCKCCQIFIHVLVDSQINFKKRFYRDITGKNNGKQLFSKSFISLNSVNRRPIKTFPSNLNKNEIK